MTMTSVKDLIQGSYERSNGKIIIHAGGQIIDTKGENDSLFRGFRGMMISPLTSAPQLSHLKINLDKILNHNFGNVYLARHYPNDQVEILKSAPLLVKFKTRNVEGQDAWGYDIPRSIDLLSELKKRHANAVVWLPVIEVND
ncbi:hypothetical protein [Limosilactobacillus reuteri]|uniref:Uncharacterized protein n=1 Tax=Limosilactobacillus reuteri TaxID=1598 RepID=A0A256VJ31_LIMRT|nr:hypothetical protein [Limosilactobacillus reuteri]OYS59689.1 hypothetical protein CBF88_05235 [Limosilactobacillus reuteri]OYS61280.1 hypothetical protein CBF91_05860 [Limosilactobacillus reuteri]OYS64451.1 hypothetical protein CBF89_05610 [Limosilactobacillus reuteri]OYS72488.1 hypothetical protein CBG01_05530 [Limosilactobacillus reuteri]OYS75054.1 hypothetical protein CBG08_05465 [Limosilactobacillus reuteri]